MRHQLFKVISCLLVCLILSGQVNSGSDGVIASRWDNLAASLLSDDDINPERSGPGQIGVAKKTFPGAIGDGLPLLELLKSNFPERAALSDDVRERIDTKIRHAVTEALKLHRENREKILPEDRWRVEDVESLLTSLQSHPVKNIYIFNAVVKGPKDYLLAFNFLGTIGLSVELIERLSVKRLAQCIYHECKKEEIEYDADTREVFRDDHREGIEAVQVPVFGEEEVVELGKGLRLMIDETAKYSQREVFAFTEPMYVTRLSPDGRWLVGGGNSGVLWRNEYDAASREFKPRTSLTDNGGSIWSIAFSRDSMMMVTGGRDAILRVYMYFVEINHGVLKQVVDDFKLVYSFPTHMDDIWCTDISPDGRNIVSGGKDGKAFIYEKKMVKFEPRALAIPIDIKGEADPFINAKFSPCGKKLALGTRGGNLYVFEKGDGGFYLSQHISPEIIGSEVTSIDFSDDGEEMLVATGEVRKSEDEEDAQAATGEGNGKVYLFNSQEGRFRKIQGFSSDADNTPVYSARFARKSKGFSLISRKSKALFFTSKDGSYSLSGEFNFGKDRSGLYSADILGDGDIITTSWGEYKKGSVRVYDFDAPGHDDPFSWLEAKGKEEERHGDALSDQNIGVRATLFANNLKKILEEKPEETFVLALDSDIGNDPAHPIAEIQRAVREIKDMKGYDGKPLFPNLKVVRRQGHDWKLAGELKRLVSEEGVKKENIFMIVKEENMKNRRFKKFEKEAWITAIDDSLSTSPDEAAYIPVLEAITITMLAYLGADNGSIKEIYDVVSEPVSLERVEEMVKNKVIYILPRMEPVKISELKATYQRVRAIYLAA